MNYNIIGSSSNGNCIIVDNKIMLDCGLSYAKIKPYLNKIKLIFISHIHQDHLNIRTINKIRYNYPNIKFLCGSKDIVEKLATTGLVEYKNIYLVNSGKWYDLGICKVKLEQLTHDVPNHCLKWQINGYKGIYLVDTSNVDNIKAKDYDLYLIESNYQDEILQKHIENATQEELVYLNRVSNTHLSYNQANSFLIENMNNNSQFEYIHKSSYNFNEEGK